MPIEVVATTWPDELVERTALFNPENQVVVKVVRVELAFAKFSRPVHVLLLASRVELAAVIVMEPPNETPEPLIVTEEFCN